VAALGEPADQLEPEYLAMLLLATAATPTRVQSEVGAVTPMPPRPAATEALQPVAQPILAMVVRQALVEPAATLPRVRLRQMAELEPAAAALVVSEPAGTVETPWDRPLAVLLRVVMPLAAMVWVAVQPRATLKPVALL
jgi:hypothetical protein